jgi:hypothetical protein
MAMGKSEADMRIFQQVLGYYYAVHNYLNTPKGRHDAIDYTRAAVIILATAFLVKWLIQWYTM